MDERDGILTLHMLHSQNSDPRREVSYSQIKMCKCKEWSGWWIVYVAWMVDRLLL
jgi:hypothetical protein